MVTTKITLTPYLAEYLWGLYNNGSKEPVKFPDNSDLYHLIWDLMIKRPVNISCVDEGNFQIALPDRRAGKDPAYYNYLSLKSQKLIEKRVRSMFNTDLHQTIEENENNECSTFTRIDVVHIFMCSYGIDSITEDALLKNYSRWRDNNRKRKVRRKYKKKLKHA